MKAMILVACVATVCAAMPAARAATAGDYGAEVLQGLEGLVPLLPYYATTAREVAERMAAGGGLWLAGDRGFVMEGLGRAGGLMVVKWLQKPEDLKVGDTVLYGMLAAPSAEDQDFLQETMKSWVLCVAFTPQPDETWGALYLRVPAAPAGDPQRLPTVVPVEAAALWTFTAELVAALTRMGKMPPMYQSVLVPGGRERNAEHLKLQWEPATPEPIKAMVLGRTYLARVSNILRTLRATQLDQFAAAGKLAAEAIRSGHTAWYACLGHLPPELPGQPGDPGVLKPLTMSTPEKLGDFVKAGDVILYVGYYEPYGPWVETAHQLGAKIVTVVSGTPERAAKDMGADINIDGCWPYGDALVEIPGYDIKVLPPSGVIQSVAYWMLVAETTGAL